MLQNIKALQSLYAHPDDVDVFVGALLEKLDNPSPTVTITSPVFQCIVADQFRRLKFGDPYFFDLAGPATPFTAGEQTLYQKKLVK